MEHIKTLLFLSFVVISQALNSQSTLTLQEAIAIGLSNNYNIIIARNNVEIAKANNTLGNAGFLPDVNLNLGQNFNVNNTKQEFFSGDTREGNGVNSSSTNANLLATWTLFDGMAMFVNKDRLEELQALGTLNVELQMENTISNIMMLFYNIEQQLQRINTIEKAIEISKERKELAVLKKNIGTGSDIDILQAEVDINADSTSLVRQYQLIQLNKIQLNEWMGRDPQMTFDIVPEDRVLTDFEYQDILQKATNRNKSLQVADKNIAISALNIKSFEANRYPTVDLNLGYSFTRSQTEIGLLKFNQNSGVAFGLTGRWNIFSGGNNKRQIQVAKLGMETNKLTKQQTQLGIETDIFTAYTAHLQAIELSKMEDKNILVAQRNLDITTNKMKIGTINALELRQAQLNLIDAEFRKIEAAFDANLAEIELMRLSGDLVK